MFEIEYQPLSSEHPEWGTIGVIPWDTEIFGFPVAELKIGEPQSIAQNRNGFQEVLCAWASRYRAEIVSCSVPADDYFVCALLQVLDFRYVDSSINIVQSRLKKTDFPPMPVPIRFASPADEAEVERIAEHAFRFGRYHSDPFFPRALSEQRYRRWVRNAFATFSPENAVYVMGETGHIQGFSHIENKDNVGYVSIIAVDKDLQGAVVGYDLCLGLMITWKQANYSKIVGKISSVNMPMLNMALNFGFRVADPLTIFHWHAPNAPHLHSLEQVYAG